MISAVFKFLIQHRSLSYKHSNNYLPHSFRSAKIFTNPITMNKSIPQTYSHCTLPVTCPARPHSLTRPMHAKSSVTRPRDQYWIKHLSLDGSEPPQEDCFLHVNFYDALHRQTGEHPHPITYCQPPSVKFLNPNRTHSLTTQPASHPASTLSSFWHCSIKSCHFSCRDTSLRDPTSLMGSKLMTRPGTTTTPPPTITPPQLTRNSSNFHTYHVPLFFDTLKVMLNYMIIAAAPMLVTLPTTMLVGLICFG